MYKVECLGPAIATARDASVSNDRREVSRGLLSRRWRWPSSLEGNERRGLFFITLISSLSLVTEREREHQGRHTLLLVAMRGVASASASICACAWY